MPTATPFKALGRGNGFPFNPKELAVEPVNGSLGMTINAYNALYATWNGGNFIGLSNGQGFSQPFSNILDAMPTYWNLYNFYLSASAEVTRDDDTQNKSVTNFEISQSVERDPTTRICKILPAFRNISSARVSFYFNQIYYFNTGTTIKYYWGLAYAYIDLRVNGGTITHRSYEHRQNNEYEDFIFTITPNLKIAMAFNSSSPFDSVNITASIDSVNYYTY